MASAKDIYEADMYAAGMYAAGIWRGVGVDIVPAVSLVIGRLEVSPTVEGHLEFSIAVEGRLES